MSTAVFVVVLVAGVVAVQLVLWVAVRVWFRHRRGVIATRLNSELAAEAMIRSPEPGSYRGATVAGFPIVNNDGMIALTRRRLIFQALTGKVIEVPVTDIVGVGEADVFKAEVSAGRRHLIIQTASGEVGFYVGDHAAWIASLTSVGVQPAAVGGSTAGSSGESGRGGVRVVRASVRRRAILAVVITSVGLVFAAVAGISAAVIAQSISTDRYIDGTVVELPRDGRSYVPVVEFMRPDGAPVRFTGLGSNPAMFRVGERVGVRYDPDNPQDARIDEYWQIWFFPTLSGICAVPFLVVGIALGVVTLRARRQAHP